jgi:hypothetical protein
MAKSARTRMGRFSASPLASRHRVKQTAKSLFMCKIAATLLSDDMHLGKAFSILKDRSDPPVSKRPGKGGPAFSG